MPFELRQVLYRRAGKRRFVIEKPEGLVKEGPERRERLGIDLARQKAGHEGTAGSTLAQQLQCLRSSGRGANGQIDTAPLEQFAIAFGDTIVAAALLVYEDSEITLRQFALRLHKAENAQNQQGKGDGEDDDGKIAL